MLLHGARARSLWLSLFLSFFLSTNAARSRKELNFLGDGTYSFYIAAAVAAAAAAAAADVEEVTMPAPTVDSRETNADSRQLRADS